MERRQALGLGRIEIAVEMDDDPCRLLGLLPGANLDGPDPERRDDHGWDNDRRPEDEDSERPLADSPILVRHEDNDGKRAGLGIRVVEDEGLVRVEGQRLASMTVAVIDYTSLLPGRPLPVPGQQVPDHIGDPSRRRTVDHQLVPTVRIQPPSQGQGHGLRGLVISY